MFCLGRLVDMARGMGGAIYVAPAVEPVPEKVDGTFPAAATQANKQALHCCKHGHSEHFRTINIKHSNTLTVKLISQPLIELTDAAQPYLNIINTV